MTDINFNSKVLQYQQTHNVSEEEAKKAVEQELEQENQEENSYNDLSNAVNDDNASYGALEAQAQQGADNVVFNEVTASSAPKYIIKADAEIVELDGIKLAVDKSLKNSDFSYELIDNKLVIDAKKCTIDITEVTNKDIEIELNGSNITFNSNLKVKSIVSNAMNTTINGSDENDNISVNGMNTTVNLM